MNFKKKSVEPIKPLTIVKPIETNNFNNNNNHNEKLDKPIYNQNNQTNNISSNTKNVTASRTNNLLFINVNQSNPNMKLTPRSLSNKPSSLSKNDIELHDELDFIDAEKQDQSSSKKNSLGFEQKRAIRNNTSNRGITPVETNAFVSNQIIVVKKTGLFF